MADHLRRALRTSGMQASMGGVGDALDSAVAECFFATRKAELTCRRPSPTHHELEMELFSLIERIRQPVAAAGYHTTLHPHDRLPVRTAACLAPRTRPSGHLPQTRADGGTVHPLAGRRPDRRLRFRGTALDNRWLHHRVAALNLRRLPLDSGQASLPVGGHRISPLADS
jgi:hypothetical protein